MILLEKQFMSNGDILKTTKYVGKEMYSWTRESQDWIGEETTDNKKAPI